MGVDFMLSQWIYRWFYRHRPQNFKPVVLVTGCGSGIGRALARALYHLPQYRVVVTAREKSLAELHAELPETDRFLIRALDVTQEPQRDSVVSEIEQRWKGVNILINNAGISYRSVIEHMTEKDEQLQMATNYLGPMGLIRRVLPHMRKEGRGKIISVSSVSGMLAMPTMASYSASKYALEGACEALWYEGKPLGIDVSLVQPGFIHSNSFKNVYYSPKSDPSISEGEAYSDYYHYMAPFVEKMMNRSWSTPEKVAQTILGVVQQENPPLWIAATFDASFFYYVRRLLPRRWLLPFLFACLPHARSWGKPYTKKRHIKPPAVLRFGRTTGK